jgi:hypothetical protein
MTPEQVSEALEQAKMFLAGKPCGITTSGLARAYIVLHRQIEEAGAIGTNQAKRLSNASLETAALKRQLTTATARIKEVEATHIADLTLMAGQADRIAELEAEIEEQARLNGMGSEREARLMAERDQARADHEREAKAADMLYKQKLALEADNAHLLSRLALAEKLADRVEGFFTHGESKRGTHGSLMQSALAKFRKGSAS